jgi:hypothetical protein
MPPFEVTCGTLLLYKSTVVDGFISVDVHICSCCRLYIMGSGYVLSHHDNYIGYSTLTKSNSQYTFLYPSNHADATSDESREKK